MSVEGLRTRWRDEGTIAGVALALTAGDPVPAFPLSQTTGLLAVSVAVDATVTLWAASASPLTAFDYCYVMAGAYPTVDGLADEGETPILAGQLGLTCNTGDAAEQLWIEQLRAGFPYRRFSNVARYDLTPGGDPFTEGTADVVDRLQYYNNTSAALTVRYLLAKA
jgi:hypothetical protein